MSALEKWWLATLITVLIAVLFPAAAVAASPRVTGRITHVTDGDTVRLATGERICIAGIDAPETQSVRARCKREVGLGLQAKREAKTLLGGKTVTLLGGKTVTFRRVGRSYDRTVADMALGGRDVAELLVASGVAKRWPRGDPKPNWCAR